MDVSILGFAGENKKNAKWSCGREIVVVIVEMVVVYLVVMVIVGVVVVCLVVPSKWRRALGMMGRVLWPPPPPIGTSRCVVPLCRVECLCVVGG